MKVVASLVVMLVSVSAFAKWAPIKDTTHHKCEKLQAAVKTNGFQHYTVNGEPVLPHYTTYWAKSDECNVDEVASPAFVPTKDSDSCFVGYTCAMDPNKSLTDNSFGDNNDLDNFN